MIHIHITNGRKLDEDIRYYERIFPNSFKSYEQIRECLLERVNDPVGQTFGLSVADDWSDKCYGFEVDKVTPSMTTFLYLGLWKC